jgi:3'(2'), 5'-bisphosphate nucleotidase
MLPTEERSRLIEALVDIVAAAGREIMKVYASKIEVETKEDASPLTRADLASHNLILRSLRSLTPEIPVVSEEAALPDLATRRTWNRHWLVDPLDGTKEFINRNGEFTVNIALVESHRATLGVVGVPTRQAIYVGDVATGRAERRDSSGLHALAARRMDSSRKLMVVASRSHGGDRLETFMDAVVRRFGAVERTPIGSSLKLCVLAEGRADLYPRLGPTSEWDIAAAHALLSAAGGEVWGFDRAPLRYNAKESFLNPDFVAVADAQFDWWSHLPSVAVE